MQRSSSGGSATTVRRPGTFQPAPGSMSGWVTAVAAVVLLLSRATNAQSSLFTPQFIQQQQQQQTSGASDAADPGAKAGQLATILADRNITKQETALTALTDSADPAKAAAAVRRLRCPLACANWCRKAPQLASPCHLRQACMLARSWATG